LVQDYWGKRVKVKMGRHQGGKGITKKEDRASFADAHSTGISPLDWWWNNYILEGAHGKELGWALNEQGIAAKGAAILGPILELNGTISRERVQRRKNCTIVTKGSSAILHLVWINGQGNKQ